MTTLGISYSIYARFTPFRATVNLDEYFQAAINTVQTLPTSESVEIFRFSVAYFESVWEDVLIQQRLPHPDFIHHALGLVHTMSIAVHMLQLRLVWGRESRYRECRRILVRLNRLLGEICYWPNGVPSYNDL